MNKIFTTIIILLLIIESVFVGYEYFLLNQKMETIIAREQANANIIAFDKMFVEKVLKTQGEISYQDRLLLENAVVATKDSDIQAAWKNFLASTTEQDAQNQVLVLLSLFPNKIVY